MHVGALKNLNTYGNCHTKICCCSMFKVLVWCNDFLVLKNGSNNHNDSIDWRFTLILTIFILADDIIIY